MNNDYERYDFWHREMASIKPAARSMEKLVESNRIFDERKAGKKSIDDSRSEDINGYAISIITNNI